jgi:ribokinase
MEKPRIVVIGSSNTDMIIKLDRIPRPGETILGGEFASAAGGKGANQAVAAARAGGDVTFVARVGQDMFGEKAVAGFVQDGIHVEYVARDPAAPSGMALIFVAQDGENSIAVAGGANGRLSPAEVKKAERAIADASVVLMQLETPLETVQAAAELAAWAEVPVILNPAPARVLPDKLLKLVSILTPNESEAELLTGIAVSDEATAAQAAEQLRARGVETVIVTLGARGAWVADASSQELVPAFPAEPVDTTGAGDVFNGALAVALGEGRPLLEAVRFANAAAAISVTRLGAQPSAPDRKEIESLLARANTAKRAGARVGVAAEDGGLGQTDSRGALPPPDQFRVRRQHKQSTRRIIPQESTKTINKQKAQIL